MIESEKLNKALRAIHDLIIQARILTMDLSKQEMFEFLDGLEYLPNLLAQEDDMTIQFESFLEQLCIENNCVHIFKRYKMRSKR